MPWTTVVFLAASPWRSVKERLLVKSRSVGERIENFMATWLDSQEQGTHADRIGNGNRQKSRYGWVPGELEPRGGRFGTAMLGEQKSGDCSFSTFALCLLFMGHFFLNVPCAPNIEPSNTGRSTVNTSSGSLNSHFGLVFLTFCPVAVAAEGSVPLGTPRTSATCVQTSLPSVSQDPGLIFIAVPP